jgi:hypothetical protein
VLAGSNKEVVIKVLRPGTEDVLLTDLNFVSVSLFHRHSVHVGVGVMCSRARVPVGWRACFLNAHT